MSSSYSANDPWMFDTASRQAQAAKIARVLEAHAGGAPRPGTRLLDIGCSSGIILGTLASHWPGVSATGADVDLAALRAAAKQQTAARFACAPGARLPFPANTFDYAICNQVYQYVPDVPALLAEIARALRPGGLCYFGARNLLGLLSLQNWPPFAATYAPMLMPRGAWSHRAGRPWPYRRLRRAAERHFQVHDYTTRVLSDPALAGLFAPAPARAWLARAPRAILGAVMPFLPTHIWVLEKQDR